VCHLQDYVDPLYNSNTATRYKTRRCAFTLGTALHALEGTHTIHMYHSNCMLHSFHSALHPTRGCSGEQEYLSDLPSTLRPCPANARTDSLFSEDKPRENRRFGRVELGGVNIEAEAGWNSEEESDTAENTSEVNRDTC
jgi:hypothetical protein